MGASDRIQGVIFDLNWTILHTASSDDYVITGDMPVCRYTAGQMGGFFHPEVEVTLPLSASCALLMSREPLSSPFYMPSELVCASTRCACTTPTAASTRLGATTAGASKLASSLRQRLPRQRPARWAGGPGAGPTPAKT